MEIKNYCATKYILGSGSLETLSQYKGKKVALVVDENIIRALNLEQRLYQEILAGVDYRVICSITHEPTMAELEAPIRTVQEYQPDYIVGIGGGSVMDSAKVLWLFYELPHYDWARAMVPYGVDPFPGKAQMIAVPTTSGTGSETTCCAMVKDSENLKKMILSFEVVPTVAIMDFDLLKSLPPRNVAYSGTDALAHALGAAVSKPASGLVRAVALQASVMLVKNLPASAVGNQDAREAVHIAATLAGQAINNSMTGLEHAMAKAGEVFNLPHGLVSGLMLPYVMRWQIPNPVYAELASQLEIPGTGEARQFALVDAIWDMYDKIGMPRTLREAGVDEQTYLHNLPVHLAAMRTEFGLETGPKRPDEADLETLFRQFYYGI